MVSTKPFHIGIGARTGRRFCAVIHPLLREWGDAVLLVRHGDGVQVIRPAEGDGHLAERWAAALSRAGFSVVWVALPNETLPGGIGTTNDQFTQEEVCGAA